MGVVLNICTTCPPTLMPRMRGNRMQILLARKNVVSLSPQISIAGADFRPSEDPTQWEPPAGHALKSRIAQKKRHSCLDGFLSPPKKKRVYRTISDR